MPRDPEADRLAAALRTSIGLLVRRLRQTPVNGDLSLPETAVLKRLEGGPTGAASLARLEGIRPQSMGATLAALERRGYVRRERDPADGRRALVSVTDSGLRAMRTLRDARVRRLAQALGTGFTASERKALASAAPLLERLAQHL